MNYTIAEIIDRVHMIEKYVDAIEERHSSDYAANDIQDLLGEYKEILLNTKISI